MEAALINPFIEATRNVLKTMAQIEARAGKPVIKKDSNTWGDVTGVIGMAGDHVRGSLIVSFQREVILKVVSAMLMEEYSDINQEVVDAVGELTNMICGGTKAAISEYGYAVDMATPLVIAGQGVHVSQLSQTPVISVPFDTAVGKFVIEATLQRTEK